MPSRKQEAELDKLLAANPPRGSLSREEFLASVENLQPSGKPLKPRFAYGPDSLFERCVYEGRGYPIGGDK